MGTFTTNIELGATAFCVSGSLDYRVEKLTVGQVRVQRTLPKARSWDDDPVYKEEYMCIETGVGSGNIWEYGKNIFNNEKDALAACVKRQQESYKQRAERDAHIKKQAEYHRERDLEKLRELKEKYEKEG